MKPTILLIEDNEDDVIIIKRGLKKGKIANDLVHVTNGLEGLNFIHDHAGLNIELILLDLNMEVMNGFEFLQKRLENPKIKKIPTIVLTTSSRPEDIERAYDLGANAYVEKPVEPKEFINTILKIEDFWIILAKKP